MLSYLDQPVKRDLWLHIKLKTELKFVGNEIFRLSVGDSSEAADPRDISPSISLPKDLLNTHIQRPLVTIFKDQSIVSFAVNPVRTFMFVKQKLTFFSWMRIELLLLLLIKLLNMIPIIYLL
jgi:hypothetical protein